MASPAALDQWLLEMINWVRLDPAGVLGPKLNEGLPPGTLSGEPVQALAINDILLATSQFQSDWMLEEDLFGTIGELGSNPGQRMNYAGYDFGESGVWAETVNRFDYGLGSSLNMDTVASRFFRALLDDPGARTLMLRPDLAEIGVSQLLGTFTLEGTDFTSAMLTVDYAAGTDTRFITGRIYGEPLPDWPSPVEGTAGISVTGTDDTDVSRAGGGYSILATSESQAVSIGGLAVQILMPAGNIKVDYVNNSRVETSHSLTVLSGALEAGLVGAAAEDLSAADTAGAIRLYGNRAANALNGNASANLLDGAAGADTMAGGDGDDRYIVDNAGDVVLELVGHGYDRVFTSVSFALTAGSHVEELRTENDIFPWAIDLTGNELAQTLIGNHGNNWLDGGGGGDVLRGSVGNDTYVIRDSRDVIQEYASPSNNEGQDRVLTTIDYALGAANSIEWMETLAPGGTAPLRLTGNDYGQTIVGNEGDNRLYGLGGNDTLVGNGGADKLYGGLGDDTFIITDLGDKAYENNGEGIDTVLSSVTYSLVGQYIEHLTLTGTGAINATGNTLANIIQGNQAANRLDGGAGADQLHGGDGDDTYVVDNAGDRVFEARDAGHDTVESAVSFSLVGQYVEDLILTGSGHIKAKGNSFANTITGNSGSNTIDGGTGADVLFGGGGSDKFVFSTNLHASNVDTILDFTVGRDKLHLDIDVFGAFAATGALTGSAFKNLSTGAVDSTDRILFNQSTGDLFYDADGSGALAAIRFANLDNGAVVTASDFLLI